MNLPSRVRMRGTSSKRADQRPHVKPQIGDGACADVQSKAPSRPASRSSFLPGRLPQRGAKEFSALRGCSPPMLATAEKCAAIRPTLTGFSVPAHGAFTLLEPEEQGFTQPGHFPYEKVPVSPAGAGCVKMPLRERTSCASGRCSQRVLFSSRRFPGRAVGRGRTAWTTSISQCGAAWWRSLLALWCNRGY